MPYFTDTHYLIRRKILKLIGGAFHIYDSAGAVVAYAKLKGFRLKEDLRIYTGDDMREEIFRIAARSVIDFSAGYDVIDSATDAPIGLLKRRGLKSILKDEWHVFDAAEHDIGAIHEDHMILALLRRFATDLLPQTFTCTINGQPAATFRQRFNPFVFKMDVRFEGAPQVDRRLLMAAAVLLVSIEGRQG